MLTQLAMSKLTFAGHLSYLQQLVTNYTWASQIQFDSVQRNRLDTL